ncbi:MAG: CHAD domain-containing protein [Rhodothalassiaceae bacterium]
MGRRKDTRLQWLAPKSPQTLRALLRRHVRRSGQTSAAFDLLDTPDFRLMRGGYMLCAWPRTGRLELHRLEDESWLAAADCKTAPRFAEDLPEGPPWSSISELVAPRALLAMLAFEGRIAHHDMRDEEGKLIARPTLETWRVRAEGAERATVLPLRFALAPLRGYEDEAKRPFKKLDMSPAEPLATAALRALGHDPRDPNGERPPKLGPDMTVAQAALAIIAHQLSLMRRRESGICEDVDSEFLHEYRLALRRLRSALALFGDHLPPALCQSLRREAKALGDASSMLRDLDVMLLAVPGWRQALPPEIREALVPALDLLAARRRKALALLRRRLNSARYREDMARLGAMIAAARQAVTAEPPDRRFADHAALMIGKAARRLRRDGRRISDDSPPEALHDLRKRSKKLRYLVEFAADLLEPAHCAAVLKSLKRLQNCLGTIQDSAVATAQIEAMAVEMEAADRLPVSCALALGRLMGHLDEAGRAARADFSSHFAAFSEALGKPGRLIADGSLA